IWESTDGGATWTLLKEAKQETNGATDIEIDPQSPNTLYASFWADAIYKSTDAGKHWSPIMTGFPAGADYVTPQTRFSISLSHPAGTAQAVLYAGFDYNDAGGQRQPARIWKSTDAGAHWSILPAGRGIDSVSDYCAFSGDQCFYDNVVEADPTNPNVVFVGGAFGYPPSPPPGGPFPPPAGRPGRGNPGPGAPPPSHTPR